MSAPKLEHTFRNGRECSHRKGPNHAPEAGGCCPRCHYHRRYVQRFESRTPMLLPIQGQQQAQQEK